LHLIFRFTTSPIPSLSPFFFFFTSTSTTVIYTLSLHDALPICLISKCLSMLRGLSTFLMSYILLSIIIRSSAVTSNISNEINIRSEEHTSELQSRFDLVCRLLLEKKKKKNKQIKQKIIINAFTT